MRIFAILMILQDSDLYQESSEYGPSIPVDSIGVVVIRPVKVV